MALSDLPVIDRAYRWEDLTVRAGDGEGRTVHGLAVPYDVPTPIRDGEGVYAEMFRSGAFAQTINAGKPHRVKLHVRHDRESLPIGAATGLREDTAGLVVSLRVANTLAGDEALALVDALALDGFSVGFRPVQSRWSDAGMVRGRRADRADGAEVERLEAALVEVSLVDFAAYPSAVVEGVRSESAPVVPAAGEVAGVTSGVRSAGVRRRQIAKAIEIELARKVRS